VACRPGAAPWRTTNTTTRSAHRTACASLERSFEKVGDHWEEKPHKGPSEDRAAHGGPGGGGETAGGVDVRGHTKDERYERARSLDVRGRSRMTKRELAQAIARTQR
jgi:hypothetical protein